MHSSIRIAAAAMFLSFASSATQAADLDSMSRDRAVSLVKEHAALTRASSADSFRLLNVVRDANGAEHVRLARSYRGLPVIGGDMVVHIDGAGAFKGASLTQSRAIDLDVRGAKIDAAKAIRIAEQQFAGSRDGAARSELAVYARGDRPVLVHDVVLAGFNHEGTPSRLHVIVSADRGKVLDRYDEIMTGATTGTGNSLYSGTVGIGTDSTSSGFQMLDPTRGDQYTLDLKDRRFGRGAIFTDSDNVWGDGTNDDRASAGVDAHFGMQTTWDYFKNVMGRDGIADDGQGAYSRVHYSRNYSNAYWSDDCFCMTYGDGDGRTILPLVSLDVAGHEMTHGVTSNTAGLIYSGESGGLNEATSDIFGSMVEFYANSPADPGDYLEGEQIYAANAGDPTPTVALRYMFKPSLDGTSPDCYTSNVGNLDVHYSSGIGNHFYYLLAEGAVVPPNFGSLSKADLVCNGNTALVGVGRDAAAKIFYRALSVYMTSSTNYKQARTATLNAATDLYGNGSTQYNAVAAAWSAVSVN